MMPFKENDGEEMCPFSFKKHPGDGQIRKVYIWFL